MEEDYKKKFEEAIEKIKKLKENLESNKNWNLAVKEIEDNFPETKEIEGEKIRKALVKYFTSSISNPDYEICGIPFKEVLAWFEKQGSLMKCLQISNSKIGDLIEENYYLRENLEKQGEQKPTDNVEPRFHEGDWIIFNGLILHIDEIIDGYYRTTSIGGTPNSYDWAIDNAARLWTIEDAKEGDVLSYVTDEENLWIMIYWSLYEPYEGHVHYHALLVNDNFDDKGTCCICIDNLKPATKELRDLLFQKMKENGYEWNAEKKELKKIEQNSTWSEKDNTFFKAIIRDIENIQYISEDAKKDRINWLKFLKDRVQPQNRWISIDKEVYIKELVLAQKKDKSDPFKGYVVCCDHTLVPNIYERYIRLDNNCSENIWKPTKKQIMALRWVLNHIPYGIHKEEISGLFDQIKEL